MKYLVIALSCLVFLTTCKKYPEGGYHFRYLKNLEGYWKLKLFEADGVDSTSLTLGANTIPGYLENFASIGSHKSNKVLYIELTCHYRTYHVNLNPKHELISFAGANDNGFDSLGCSFQNSQTCQRNILNPKNEKQFVWKIEKLTKSELILLSTDYNYKIILIKK